MFFKFLSILMMLLQKLKIHNHVGWWASLCWELGFISNFFPHSDPIIFLSVTYSKSYFLLFKTLLFYHSAFNTIISRIFYPLHASSCLLYRHFYY